MATSLGKQSIFIEIYLNRMLRKSYIEQRCVYQKADGVLQVNYLNDKRRILKREDGSFYWRIDTYSLPIHRYF